MIHRMTLAVVLMAALSFMACGTSPEPFEYESDTEAKPGRGVFTGEEGAWTIYRKEMPPEEAAQPAENSESEKGAAASSDKEGAPVTVGADSE